MKTKAPGETEEAKQARLRAERERIGTMQDSLGQETDWIQRYYGRMAMAGGRSRPAAG